MGVGQAKLRDNGSKRKRVKPEKRNKTQLCCINSVRIVGAWMMMMAMMLGHGWCLIYVDSTHVTMAGEEELACS